MRYSRNAIGLLTAQYKSVLKKCFLINAGLFILAAPIFSSPAMAENGIAVNRVVINGDTALPQTIWNGGVYEEVTQYNDFNFTGSGAAMAISGGTVTADGLSFNRNTATGTAGAIQIGGSSVVSYIKNTTFEGNSGTSGGALYIGSGASVALIENTDFIGNVASSKWGNGGAVNSGSGTGIALKFVNGKMERNTTYGNGGGVVSTTSALDFDGTSFTGNNAGTSGGAIYGANGITIANATFDGNYAGTNGGAVDSEGGTLTINNSTFKNNYVTNGQGGAVYIKKGSVASITDSTFTANHTNESATGNGGAIWNEGTLTFSGENTFSGNYRGTTDNLNDIRNGATMVVAENSVLNIGGGILGGYRGNNIVNMKNASVLNLDKNAYITNNTVNSDGATLNVNGDGVKFTGTDLKWNSGKIEATGKSVDLIGSGVVIGSEATIEVDGLNLLNNQVTSTNEQGETIVTTVNSSFSSAGDSSLGDVNIETGGTFEVIDGETVMNNLDNSGNVSLKGQTEANDVTNKKGGVIAFSGKSNVNGTVLNSGVIYVKDSSIIDGKIDWAAEGEKGNIFLEKGATTTLVNEVANNALRLRGGVLNFGENGALTETSSLLISDQDDEVVSGDTIISTVNNVIKDTSFGVVTMYDNANINLEINMEDVTGDSFSANSINDGETMFSLKDITLLGGNPTHDSGSIKVTDNVLKERFQLATDSKFTPESNPASSFAYTYVVRSDGGYLKFLNINSLVGAVQREDEATRVYEMGADETVKDDLGDLQGTQLTVNGNDYTVDGNGKGGVTVVKDQVLTVQDNITVGGFKDGVFITNDGGVINLQDTVVMNNQIVNNTGVVNIGADVALNGGVNNGATVNFNTDHELTGALSGNGAYNVNEGTFTVGENGSVGADTTINVYDTFDIGSDAVEVGNIVFHDQSTLKVKIDTLADYGSLGAQNVTVTEGATINATLGQGVLGDKRSGEVTILTSANGFDDNFNPVQDNNMYTFTKVEGKDGVYRVALYNTGEEVAKENGATSNEIAAGAAWIDGDEFAEGTVGSEIADKLADLAQNDGKKYVDELQALSPFALPLVKTASITHSNRVFDMVGNHLRAGDLDINDYSLASGDNILEDSSVWFKAYLGTGTLDDEGRVEGFDLDGKGFVLAADKKVAKNTKVGLGYGYDSSEADNNTRDVDIDTHSVFAYAEYKPNAWFVNGVVSYNMADYDEEKKVMGAKYKADYDVDYVSVQTKVGYEYEGKHADITPEVGLRYNHIERDGYTDTATQKVASHDMDVLTVLAGARVSKTLLTKDCRTVTPFAYVGASYDVISDDEDAFVSLANGSSYTVYDKGLDRFAVEAGAGVNAEITYNLEAYLNYYGQFRGNYTNHTGMIGAKYKF